MSPPANPFSTKMKAAKRKLSLVFSSLSGANSTVDASKNNINSNSSLKLTRSKSTKQPTATNNITTITQTDLPGSGISTATSSTTANSTAATINSAVSASFSSDMTYYSDYDQSQGYDHTLTMTSDELSARDFARVVGIKIVPDEEDDTIFISTPSLSRSLGRGGSPLSSVSAGSSNASTLISMPLSASGSGVDFNMGTIRTSSKSANAVPPPIHDLSIFIPPTTASTPSTTSAVTPSFSSSLSSSVSSSSSNTLMTPSSLSTIYERAHSAPSGSILAEQHSPPTTHFFYHQQQSQQYHNHQLLQHLPQPSSPPQQQQQQQQQQPLTPYPGSVRTVTTLQYPLHVSSYHDEYGFNQPQHHPVSAYPTSYNQKQQSFISPSPSPSPSQHYPFQFINPPPQSPYSAYASQQPQQQRRMRGHARSASLPASMSDFRREVVKTTQTKGRFTVTRESVQSIPYLPGHRRSKSRFTIVKEEEEEDVGVGEKLTPKEESTVGGKPGHGRSDSGMTEDSGYSSPQLSNMHMEDVVCHGIQGMSV